MTDDLAERVAGMLWVGNLTLRLSQLESAVTGLQRAGKRQAAPFSRGAPKPQKPGRHSGEACGPKAHRAVPTRSPDLEVVASLPGHCPDCGGEVEAIGEG